MDIEKSGVSKATGEDKEEQRKVAEIPESQNRPSENQKEFSMNEGIAHEQDGSSNQASELINELRIKLAEESKERKKIAKSAELLQKQLKDSELKLKAAKATEEKLVKMTKLRDQMSAVVQSLKQEKEVFLSQQETNTSTITLQKETLQSYTVIIANHESKLVEKEKQIMDQDAKLKEQRIGLDVHKNLAMKFMEIKDDIEESTDTVDQSSSAEELKNIYAQLQSEETKNQELRNERDKLKTEQLELQNKISWSSEKK